MYLLVFFYLIACRTAKKYAYENLITRETQFEKPEDEDEDEDNNEETEVKKSEKPENPPLPPPEEVKNPPLPPPPPEISLPPLPTPQNQVEDMDLSEDDETDVPPIETPKEPSKDDHLSNALSSFYSDIAGIDGSSQETTPAPTPPKVNSPSSSLGRASPALSDDRSNSPFCADSQDESKKRKV